MIGKRFGSGAPPLVLGHRGSPRRATENTLLAFFRAVEEGADGVELDVQRTRDGVAAVVHDETLDRTMGVGGVVAEMPWGAIEQATGSRVPSLEQAAAWAAASGAWLNIEVKAAGLEHAVLTAIRTTGIGGRVVVSSFDPDVLRAIGRVDDRTRRFLLTRSWTSRSIRDVADTGATGVCLHVDAATDENLRDVRSRGLGSIAWTVNDPAELERLFRAGVDAVITDDPAGAAAVRARLGPADRSGRGDPSP